MKMLIKILKYLLWPLSLIYGGVIIVRNWLYDTNFFKVFESKIITINIGNLTAGGTGKTPHVEYLIKLLDKTHQVATLSRGYGRKTTGFVQANINSDASEIGDEPLQIFKKFGGSMEVFVCEKRAAGLQRIEVDNPEIDLIILDDAFQHRAIKPKINILITDYNRLFTNDLMLPSGLLREPKSGAKRADAIIVSKCSKSILESEKDKIKQQIYQYSQPNCPVFFSTFQYESPQPYFQNQPKFDVKKTTILLSGIAQPRHFEAAALQKFEIDRHLTFKDHHSFSERDLPKTDYQILTTEKDLVKIKSILNSKENNFYFWPIEVHFLDNNTQNFDDWLTERLRLK